MKPVNANLYRLHTYVHTLVYNIVTVTVIIVIMLHSCE